MKYILGVIALISVCRATPLLERREHPLFSGESRIINGQEAESGAWPWQASLQRSGSHFCGGSLIATRYVITAAHCEVTSSPVTVGLGGVSWNGGLDQYIQQSQFTPHPSYSGFDYDYGVITLARNATLNGLVDVVTLVGDNVDYNAGTPATVTGWGYTRKNGNNGVIPDLLQETVVPLISYENCRELWGSSAQITDRMLCAGGGDSGSCNGDSGGPLVVLDGGEYVLIGAVSWGSTQCSTYLPSGYAKLSVERPWIRSITGV